MHCVLKVKSVPYVYMLLLARGVIFGYDCGIFWRWTLLGEGGSLGSGFEVSPFFLRDAMWPDSLLLLQPRLPHSLPHASQDWEDLESCSITTKHVITCKGHSVLTKRTTLRSQHLLAKHVISRYQYNLCDSWH